MSHKDVIELELFFIFLCLGYIVGSILVMIFIDKINSFLDRLESLPYRWRKKRSGRWQ